MSTTVWFIYLGNQPWPVAQHPEMLKGCPMASSLVPLHTYAFCTSPTFQQSTSRTGPHFITSMQIRASKITQTRDRNLIFCKGSCLFILRIPKGCQVTFYLEINDCPQLRTGCEVGFFFKVVWLFFSPESSRTLIYRVARSFSDPTRFCFPQVYPHPTPVFSREIH